MHDSLTRTDTPVRDPLVKSSGWALPIFGLAAVWTAVQMRLFDVLLFQKRTDYEFVLTSIDGVLAGTPISKSWQQRILGPAAVAALGGIVSNRLLALRIFAAIMILCANALLFAIMRRKGSGAVQSLLAVVAFGFGHLLLLYRLEYPWDGFDVLLFLAFGYWAQRGGSLLSLGPLLFAGAFNHETVLYLPLFYLLAFLERDRVRALRDAWQAVVAATIIGVVILALRQMLYLGQPDLPGQVFEVATPLIANHLHITHNVEQFLHADFRAAGTWFTAGLLSCFACLVALAVKRGLLRAAVWSGLVVFSVFSFGYLNETRHYLSLLAFWFGYGTSGRAATRRVQD